MGIFRISIEGVGAHHNPDNPTDADRLAAEFVEKLQAGGCRVDAAEFQEMSGDRRWDLLSTPSGLQTHGADAADPGAASPATAEQSQAAVPPQPAA